MDKCYKQITGTLQITKNWYVKTANGLRRVYYRITNIRVFDYNGKSLPFVRDQNTAYFKCGNKIYEFWDYYVEDKNVIILESSYIGDYIEKEPECDNEPVFKIITDNPDIPHI